ncbi:MAG: alginate export family protein [Steroidobacteraceae bacterium]
MTDGKFHLDFRYRYEQVDQQGFDVDAYASTLRTRLNYTTATWNSLTAMLEAANVVVLGQYDLYNSTTNGATDRPVVADPTYTEMNQAWLKYERGAFTGIGGRQVINLDNQRFVGNVAWRQNDQTYDAVTLKLGSIPRTQLSYSWVGNVNRVTGPDNGTLPGNLAGSTSLLNAHVDLGTAGGLTLFGYWLDFDRNQPYSAAVTKNLSNASYGALWNGTWKAGDWTLGGSASCAHQSDVGQSTLDYDADYWWLEGSVEMRNYGFKVGYEVLGGNDWNDAGTIGFQTPLATLHIFQGWADKFTTTPKAGVEDFYVGGSARYGDLALNLTYHDFGTEAKALDTNGAPLDAYGREWDASAGYKFGKRYEALVKYANYSADRNVPGPQGSDTMKFWVQLSAAF